ERLRRDFAFLRELEGEQRSDLRLREVPHERLRRHGLLELTHAKIFEGRHRIDHDALVVFLQEEVLRSEEHTSELQSRFDLVCRLLLEKKKNSHMHAWAATPLSLVKITASHLTLHTSPHPALFTAHLHVPTLRISDHLHVSRSPLDTSP